MLHEGIVSDGDCLFHSVEYADNKVGLKGTFPLQHLRTIRKIIATKMHKKGYTTISNVPWKEFRDGYTWSQNDVLAELAIYKRKPICVIADRGVVVYYPKKSKLNETLFIVCQTNIHFTTFKTQPKMNILNLFKKQSLSDFEFKETYDEIDIFYFPLSELPLNYLKSITINKNKKISVKTKTKNKSKKISYNIQKEINKINVAHQIKENEILAKELQKIENQIARNFSFAKKLNRQ